MEQRKGRKNKMRQQRMRRDVPETIPKEKFRNPTGVAEHVLVCRPPLTTCYASTRNTLYYSSPFKRSKARDVFPRYYRGNFGTWHGWEIVSLRGFCLDCWFRSREKWWLFIRLAKKLAIIPRLARNWFEDCWKGRRCGQFLFNFGFYLMDLEVRVRFVCVFDIDADSMQFWI